MKKSEVIEIIDTTLGLKQSPGRVDEAYVANQKTYDMPTELLSEKLKRAHFDIYADYVKSLNNISANLDGVDRNMAHSNGSSYRTLKIDETYNLNATWLHELYFANSSDLHSEIMTDSLAFMRLERDFGTFNDWQVDFVASAYSARSGWVVCAYHMFLQRYVNVFIDSHDGHVPVGLYPVIVIDMWEHAYSKDYLHDKKLYLMGQMKELNWATIEERFKRAERVDAALKQ